MNNDLKADAGNLICFQSLSVPLERQERQLETEKYAKPIAKRNHSNPAGLFWSNYMFVTQDKKHRPVFFEAQNERPS